MGYVAVRMRSVVAILPILEAPHPVLSAKARRVEMDEFGSELSTLVTDMAETMYAAPGVGLAAPQVGDGRRILVANLEGDAESDKEDELIVMINPVILERSTEMIKWDESCLSVPEYDLDVDRHLRIHVEWQDVSGEHKEGWFEEFPSVVLQHEMDHLDGVTLLDRSSRLKRSRYISKRRKRLRERG
jgi:peptide deformylase